MRLHSRIRAHLRRFGGYRVRERWGVDSVDRLRAPLQCRWHKMRDVRAVEWLGLGASRRADTARCGYSGRICHRYRPRIGHHIRWHDDRDQGVSRRATAGTKHSGVRGSIVCDRRCTRRRRERARIGCFRADHGSRHNRSCGARGQARAGRTDSGGRMRRCTGQGWILRGWWRRWRKRDPRSARRGGAQCLARWWRDAIQLLAIGWWLFWWEYTRRHSNLNHRGRRRRSHSSRERRLHHRERSCQFWRRRWWRDLRRRRWRTRRSRGAVGRLDWSWWCSGEWWRRWRVWAYRAGRGTD